MFYVFCHPALQLYYDHNYESAKNCFERAKDEFWRSLAEASELRAAGHLTKAAEIFYSIDKAEAAAQCYFGSKDYQRAGTFYYIHTYNQFFFF